MVTLTATKVLLDLFKDKKAPVIPPSKDEKAADAQHR